MDPAFRLIPGTWQENKAALTEVRRRVFIDEQHVPEALELDALDASCYHVLVIDAGERAIGTGRINPDGKIGRMAVLKECRGQGIGSAILSALQDYACQHQFAEIYLHSQATAISFYEKHGYIINSDLFTDAGIPHRRMIKQLTGDAQCVE